MKTQRARRIAACASLLAFAVLVAVPARARDAQTERAVRARVVWQAPIGKSRTLVFTGSFKGGRFEGTLRDGRHLMDVSGDVAANGSVSGTVAQRGGKVLGSFSGTGTAVSAGNARARANGSYSLDGRGGAGAWTAVELAPGEAP
jgi:hypothetical protein